MAGNERELKPDYARDLARNPTTPLAVALVATAAFATMEGKETLARLTGSLKRLVGGGVEKLATVAEAAVSAGPAPPPAPVPAPPPAPVPAADIAAQRFWDQIPSWNQRAGVGDERHDPTVSLQAQLRATERSNRLNRERGAADLDSERLADDIRARLVSMGGQPLPEWPSRPPDVSNLEPGPRPAAPGDTKKTFFDRLKDLAGNFGFLPGTRIPVPKTVEGGIALGEQADVVASAIGKTTQESVEGLLGLGAGVGADLRGRPVTEQEKTVLEEAARILTLGLGDEETRRRIGDFFLGGPAYRSR